MLRQGDGHVGDPVHQRLADAAALLCDRGRGIEAHRLAEVHEFEPRRKIQRYKAKSLPCFLVIKARQIHELVLKVVDDVVVLVVAFGENDDTAALVQPLHRLPEGGDQPRIVADRHRVGVVEQAHGDRRDGIAEQLEEPAHTLGLAGPEVPIRVGGDLGPFHHLTRAPDVVLAGHMELSGDGAVDLAVVSDDDAGLPLQVFRSRQPVLGRKEPDEPAEHAIDPGGFFVVHFCLLSQYCRPKRTREYFSTFVRSEQVPRTDFAGSGARDFIMPKHALRLQWQGRNAILLK